MSTPGSGTSEALRVLDALARSRVSREGGPEEDLARAASETLLAVVRALVPGGSDVVSVLPLPCESYLVGALGDGSIVSCSRVEVRSLLGRSFPTLSVHRAAGSYLVGEVVYSADVDSGSTVTLGRDDEDPSWSREVEGVRHRLLEPPPTDPGELSNAELAEFVELLSRLDEDAAADFEGAYAFSRPNRIATYHVASPSHSGRSVLRALRAVAVDGAPLAWALRRLYDAPAAP